MKRQRLSEFVPKNVLYEMLASYEAAFSSATNGGRVIFRDSVQQLAWQQVEKWKELNKVNPIVRNS